jgi:protein phosphatase
MLICPQCKFENSSSNKFCQNCGTSLTHKACPQCDGDVAYNEEKCPHCGHECGTFWWAIIVKKRTGDLEIKDFSLGEVKQDEQTSPLLASASDDAFPPPGSLFLDKQLRYQVLTPLPTLEELPANTEVGVRVLDTQPLQISPLGAMLANQQPGETPSIRIDEIPSLAKPYIAIALQSQCHLGIPLIHDAWQIGDVEVVLIEDRSKLPFLLNLWRQSTTPLLEIIHCMHRMTKLWSVLKTVNCRQSLLELSNLRLDEDQSLALQRLYEEIFTPATAVQLSPEAETETIATKEQSLTIRELGLVWQTLFRESQRTLFGAMLHLLEDLKAGNIQTIVELQHRLQVIATEEESADTNIPTANLPSPERTTTPTILQIGEDEFEDSGGKSDDIPTMVLPMQLSSLENAGLTDVGRQRDHNEDNFGMETKIHKVELPNTRSFHGRGLYIVCDGMGGHAGGEVASALAVDTLLKYFETHWVSNELPTEKEICQAVLEANQAIYSLNQKDARSGVGRMGTTLVMVLIQNTQVAIAHVGDSRLYQVTRKGELKQLTLDHEVGQREISRGVEPSIAYARPDAYQLTQALGPRGDNYIIPEVQFLEIQEDTLFVLVSDGLSDNDLLENHWQTHLQPLLSSSASLESGIKNLVELANDYNGHDNITGILVRAKVRPIVDPQL